MVDEVLQNGDDRVLQEKTVKTRDVDWDFADLSQRAQLKFRVQRLLNFRLGPTLNRTVRVILIRIFGNPTQTFEFADVRGPFLVDEIVPFVERLNLINLVSRSTQLEP